MAIETTARQHIGLRFAEGPFGAFCLKLGAVL